MEKRSHHNQKRKTDNLNDMPILWVVTYLIEIFDESELIIDEYTDFSNLACAPAEEYSINDIFNMIYSHLECYGNANGKESITWDFSNPAIIGKAALSEEHIMLGRSGTITYRIELNTTLWL